MDTTIKKTLKATEQGRKDIQIAREEWKKMQKQIPATRFICIDEASAKTNMTRLYGRAKKGMRCFDTAPHGHWKTITMLSAIWADGSTEPFIFDGATNKLIFEAYIEKYLLPHLRDGDFVVMDNLSAHKGLKIQELIESKKATALYLPPYSPDLNPIEQMWSKVKSILRKLKARTVTGLHDAIALAFESVTKTDANGWFKHSGYVY